jgi:hypothetical protein
MAREQSQSEVVDLEQVTDNCKLKFYENKEYKEKCFSEPVFDGYVPLKSHHLEMLETWFSKIPGDINIIEVAAGNGETSNKIWQQLKKSTEVKLGKYIATDLFEVKSESKKIESKDRLEVIPGLPSEVAVEKYGKDCNLLLMIAPPPNRNYTIRKFEDLHQKSLGEYERKFLLYIGEMGAWVCTTILSTMEVNVGNYYNEKLFQNLERDLATLALKGACTPL